MKVRSKVIALSCRSGVSVKEGSNKGRHYYSIKAFGFDGDFFDFFSWDDDKGSAGLFLSDLAAPFVMDCELDVTTRNEKAVIDLLRIFKYSPGFDLSSLVENAKLPMADFGPASKKIDIKL